MHVMDPFLVLSPMHGTTLTALLNSQIGPFG